MDDLQHLVQDSAEHYAVYVMAKSAQDLGVATTDQSDALHQSFLDYLSDVGITLQTFINKFPDYKNNDQIPKVPKDLFPRSL